MWTVMPVNRGKVSYITVFLHLPNQKLGIWKMELWEYVAMDCELERVNISEHHFQKLNTYGVVKIKDGGVKSETDTSSQNHI